MTVATLVAVVVAPPARAQEPPPLAALPGWSAAAPAARSRADNEGPGPGASASTVPALLSLFVPGLGQARRGEWRGLAYGGLEVGSWAMFLARRSSGGDARRAYRDLAWTEARSVYDGTRVDGDFTYYETLSKWERSGAFDADAAEPGLQPETDPATYNGSIWRRALEIHVPVGEAARPGDPAYQRALEYYQSHAYRTELEWDWSGSPDAQERFRSLIQESDDDFREATLWAAVIVANHVLSATDAYVSARLRGATGYDVAGALRVRAGPARRRWGVGMWIRW